MAEEKQGSVQEVPDKVIEKVEKVENGIDLTPAQWMIARTKIETEIRVSLRLEYEQLFTYWKTNELDDVRKESVRVAEGGMQKLFDKWKEEQKPPTHEDIQQLLNQEYETFTLPLDMYSDEGDAKQETFTIRELPQAAEKKFYKQFTDRVMGNVGSLQAFTQASIDQPFEEKAKGFLKLMDESFDLLSDAVVIALNPFGKNKMITREWVQMNISSNRQWQIVECQLKVNRLKDFFFKLSQSGQTTQTILGGLSFQQLQQQ